MAQEKWLIDGAKVIDIDSVRRLKVGLVAGQVNIIGHDEPGVRLDVHSVSGRDLLVSIEGDTLEINHTQFRWENFVELVTKERISSRADISIQVPRDVALSFAVVSATGLISGLQQDASISTVSGDVVIDGLSGDLKLNAVNGEISVRDHRGKITAHTVSGDVTVSGELPRFTGDSVSGDVFLDIAGAPDEVRVNTVSGSVTVRLEDGVAAQYRITTATGRIQLDDSEITGVRGAYSGKYGVLDKTWLDFKANTITGNVSVLHQVSV